ncbi:hypothetical protein QFC21_001353 [Naganishia friedmannii]|uniref:Uncharacterized protein n=1 Tax=Naganishia friedmannii TaxID=89922 RepID=A0ACC2W3A4_9TREE|nr:hypothetical protein QFC21_001353 [Naganishia friedmannii]
MFKNGIPQMLTSYQSACQVVIGTYQQEIWNLNSAIRQKTNIIQSQERHLQQAVTLNQNLVSQLNQCTAAAEQQSAPKDTTAIPLLEAKQELEVHIKERKELEAVLQQARACLQKANEEKFNLHGELNKSKTDNAKAIDLYKLMYSTQLKSRSDQSKSFENQIAGLKLQHAAELKREREKRTRLESGMDSLTRDQLSVINDLQDKVDDQADTISSYELAMLALDEHDGRFEASAEPYAEDAVQVEFDLAEEPDDYEEKQAVNLRDAVAERNQLRVEIEKMGKEHAAAFDRIRDEHAEEMGEARKKQAAKLQQVHAWRDKLLVEVDKMGKKHAKLETNSQEQESTIGSLRLQVEDQQHIITDLELQKTSSEKNFEKLLALLSESASEEMKMRKMTLESIQQQATQLPVLFPLPSPPGCSTLSGFLHQSRNSVLPIANDQHFATLDKKPAFGDPPKPAVTGFIDQASSAVSPISSRGAQLSVSSQSASLPSALNLNPAETKSPTTLSGQNGASPIDRKRKWNRIYSPNEEGPERDGSKR